MALVVEDGSGLSTAEAFASVAGGDTYFGGRATAAATAWNAADATAKEKALRNGADYIGVICAGLWRGTKYSATQRLPYPREGVVLDGWALDRAPLPRPLVEANYEAAARSLIESGALLPDDAEPGIKSESVEVGPIKEAKAYVGTKSPVKRFTAVDALLAPLLRSNSVLERA